MPFTVFPLHGIVWDEAGNARCACHNPKCDKPGKHPAYTWGSLLAGEQVLGPAGHGLATGIRSGLFVVDTDGPDADARFRALGPLPATYTVRTPSGGRHYYFAHPGFAVRTSVGEFDRKQGEKTSHIDIRGEGHGFVVLPGSPHKSGGEYVVEQNVSIAPAPAWVLAWPGLRGSFESGAEGAFPPCPVDVESDLGKARLEMGRRACEEFEPSVAGSNGHGALWRVALQLVRVLELPLDACFQLISEVYNPRCDPPWSPRDIEHKLRQARDKSDLLPGVVPEDLDLSRLADKPIQVRTSTRRQPNPEHRYTCHIGDMPNGKKDKTSLGNVCAILRTHEEWEGVLQYDEFRDRIIAVDPPIRLAAEEKGFAEKDVTAVRCWFECVGTWLVSKEQAWDAVISVAHESKFHPVREYLASLPQGNPDILWDAARILFGSSDRLDAILVRKFLIAAARRVLSPGEKVDTMLVVVGQQGAGKSSFVPALFGDEYVSEDLADIKTKDAMIGLAGKWCIEVAELDKVLRADPEIVKAFISRRIDPYRAPYERVSSDHPRQCVYVGTTNKDDFLRDPTGERRYWIVDIRETDGVDLKSVAQWKDRLWAAAYAVATLPKEQEQHWLTREESELLARRADRYKGEDSWAAAISDYCAGREVVRVDEIFKALGGTTDRCDPKTTKRITDILRQIGCSATLQGPHRVRAWKVPDEMRKATVPEPERARRKGEEMINEMIQTRVTI